jgi:hypothetical protein
MPQRDGIWFCDLCGKRIEDSNFTPDTGRALCGGCVKGARPPEAERSVRAGGFFAWLFAILGIVFLAIAFGIMVTSLVTHVANSVNDAIAASTAAVSLFAAATLFALLRRGVLALIRIERRGS